MPRPASAKSSQATVAAALGVSTATVSNAYNRPAKVSPTVREEIFAEAARQGYTGPDPAARQLSRGRTDTLGLLLTDALPFAFSDPAAVAFTQGLATSCSGAGLNLLLISAESTAGSSTAVGNAVVDGFVVYSVRDDDPHLKQILDRRVPTVIVDAPYDVPGVDWVGPDDRAGARALADALIDLGHRRIGVIASGLGSSRFSGSADHRIARTDSVFRSRIEGIRDALKTIGVDDLPIEEQAENTVAAGSAALHALLDRRPDLTAVCALMDVMALGALTAAAERGLRVPADLTITGYDDIPQAAVAGLTTVSQPLIDKGRIAGELYLSQRPGDEPRRRVLPTFVQARTTSGRPRLR